MSDTMSDIKEVLSSQPQVRFLPILLVRNTQSFSHFYFPKGIAQMSAGGNKNALNREIGVDGKREWSFGLFDSFNRDARSLCK